MRRKWIGPTILAVLAMMMASGAEAYFEGFNSGSGGWMAYYLPSYSAQTPIYQPTGGNPGGYICSYATQLHGLYAYESPALNLGSVAGGTMKVDYKIEGTVNPAMVRFYLRKGSNYYVGNNSHSWNANVGPSWAQHTISLLDSNFQAWGSPTETFAQVAANPQYVGLLFTSSDLASLGIWSQGCAAVSIDNFGIAVVPIPAAFWLLTSGLIGVAGLGRKIRASVVPDDEIR